MLDHPATGSATDDPIICSDAGNEPRITQEGRLIVGGLIWRRDADGSPVLAVIQSDSTNWSLPRRTLDAEHPSPEFALAKVLGVPRDLLKLGQVIHVGHDGHDPNAQILAYWQVTLAENMNITRSSAELKWMSAKKAAKRLTAFHDLNALRAHMRIDMDSIENDFDFVNPGRLARKFLSPNRIRLAGEIRRIGARLAAYQFRWTAPNNYRATLLMFSKVLTAFRQRDYEGSWKCLSDVHRLELFLMDRAALDAQRIIIDEEGKTKLNGWRADAFKRIMKKVDDNETPELLGQAWNLISDSQETRFYNIGLMRRQANFMSVILIVLSAMFLLFSSRFPDLQSPISKAPSLPASGNRILLIGSFILGAMGACVSALISFSKPQVMRVPDRMLDFIITLVRPIIGGSSALISSFLLMSGIIHGEQLNFSFLFVVAFAFGFSERLVISTIGRISTK